MTAHATVCRLDLHDRLARWHCGNQFLVWHRVDQLTHRQHFGISHAGNIMNAVEGHATVYDHHGDEVPGVALPGRQNKRLRSEPPTMAGAAATGSRLTLISRS